MTTLVYGNYKTATEINTAMGRVYGHMSLAVITSMIVSFLIGTNQDLVQFFFTGIIKYIVIFAPLLFIFVVPFLLNTGIPKLAKVGVLHLFAALMGLSFAIIFSVYQMGSIFSAFMSAAILFSIMSGYGYFTKQSLDSWGKYLLIGLIAIIISSIVNIFIGSTFFQTIISAIAVILFLGLTAYDTQQIREVIMNGEFNDGVEVQGALTLYLNFINIFLSLLNLFGDKKE